MHGETEAAEDLVPNAPAEDSRQAQIYRAAARIICEKGYGLASMSDIAEAMGMTKAGIYHHIVSKDELLFGIMSYGMDVFEEMVLDRVKDIRDPVDRLKATIRQHVFLLTRDRPKEITVVLNESHSLKEDYKEHIDARKRRYVRFLIETFDEMVESGAAREDLDPRVATFAMLGMVNWVYQWFSPAGRLSDTELAEAFTDLFLRGILREPGEAAP